MSVLKISLVYFALVFAAGFLLGTLRVLWIAPRVGARRAELLEMPVMLAVTILVASWTVRHFAVPFAFSSRLGIGLLALVFLLLAEFTFVLRLRRLSLKDYWATRDPVSTTAYLFGLLVFASAPLFVARSQ